MAGSTCEDATGDCLDWQLCRYAPLVGEELEACRSYLTGPPSFAHGFCGLDVDSTPGLSQGMLAMIEYQCPGESRAVRLSGDAAHDEYPTEIWMACEVEPSSE